MMHSSQNLYDELRRTLARIDQQIAALENQFRSDMEFGTYPKHFSIYDVRLSNNSPILSEMLAARAQTLSAMASLKAAEMQQKGTRR